MSEQIQAGIWFRAEELLRLGEIGCVIGYERSPEGQVRPAFVYKDANVGRLVWDQTCHHNLTVYLRDQMMPGRRKEEPRRVATAAKPCDVRALNVLIHEEQVAREHVFVVGVACPMDIPLSLLNHKIAREEEALFGYHAGSDAETPPPLATFRKDEELLF